MEKSENSIEEIEKKLALVGGDMLKIEYLERAVKRELPNEVKKYVHIKLAELYNNRLMTSVAAKHIENAADVAITFNEKKELYLKEAELLIKSLGFDEAEKSFKKALACSNTTSEKENIKNKYKNFYMSRALELEKAQNIKKASEVYERYSHLEPSNLEIKKKLAFLYNKLGKIKEAIALEQALKNPKQFIEKQKQEDFDIDDFLKNS